MTALTTRDATATGTGVPAAPPKLRQPSEALGRAMDLSAKAREAAPTDGGDDRLTTPMALAVAGEAQQRLAAVTTALNQRADPSAIQAWVIRLITLIGHPRDPEEIAAKVMALTDLLGEVPRRCLTIRSAGMVARSAGKWFPDAKALLAVIQPEAAELEREQRRLRAVLRAASPPPPPPTLSAKERAAMSAAAAAYLAETAAREAQRRAAEMDDALGQAAARRRATSPDTTDEEIRQMAATQGAGAALARMRLAFAQKLRSGGGEGR